MMLKLLSSKFLPIATLLLLAAGDVRSQGDDCASAQVITPGTYSANGPSTGSGASNNCFGTGATNADWYVFTAPAGGSVNVYSCLGGADTRVSMYSGSCAGLICESSSDDACPTIPNGVNFASELTGVPVVQGNDYYIEWDDRWTTSGFNWVLEFDCAGAPSASQTLNLDCANNQYFIDVQVTSLGTATTVDIVNNAGAPPITGVGLGPQTIGPFPLGTQVQYTVVNTGNPGCDFFSPILENFPCPVVSCGPDNYNFCYSSNMDSVAVYQSSTSFALGISFNQGTVDSGDEIIVYDGADASAPILFQGNNGGDLTGLILTSTNPNNYLTFRIVSNGFSDCVSSLGLYDPIDFTVSCLNCTNPGATYTLVEDCIHREFSIQVNVDSTGNAATSTLVNSLNTDTIFGVTPGSTTAGPFPMDSTVNVVLLNTDNTLCRQNSPFFTSPADDCIIVGCGVDNYTYCYENDDNAWYSFQRDTVAFGTGPISVTFLSGEMLMNDRVIVYNGKNDFGAVLANTNFGGSLGGQSFNSTNPEGYITVRFVSDGTGSCADNGVNAPILFEVGCGYVGLEEIEADELLIYPNPANNVLLMQFDGLNDDNASVRVYNAMGALVLESRSSFRSGAPVELPVASLSNGHYLLQVVSDNTFKAQRFQIAR
jgi:hypothetical protein